MLRSISTVVISIFLLLNYNSGLCKKSEPILVLDEDLELRLPRNFRTAQDMIAFEELTSISTKGLHQLRISASGQFSWQTINAAITHMIEPVWIVDLRQESHGFLNGRPISWYGPENAENADKTTKEILVDEQSKLAVLRQYRYLKVHEIIEKDQGVIVKTFPRRIRVVKIETEPMLLARMRVAHVRLPVLDHHRPSDEQVDRFITMMLKRPENTWVHYHCRAGKGRATTFMVMHDMLFNAKQVSIDDIVKRQHLIGGTDLFSEPKKDKSPSRLKAYEERKAFIQQFYEYAKDEEHGYPKHNWTSWLAR